MRHPVALHPSLHHLQEKLCYYRIHRGVRGSRDRDRQYIRSNLPVQSAIVRLG